MDRADATLHGTGRRDGAAALPDPVPGDRGRIVGSVTAAGQEGDGARRHHNPARYADIAAIIDAAGGVTYESRAELAAATAEVLVNEGRGNGDDRFVGLADRVGLETLAELWRDADPVSLPGALWALYLLRQWCHSSEDEVVRLWRAGEPVAAVEAAVAGVDDLADVDSVRRVADAVLTGVYRGDLAVALERAAALFRVIAAGRRELAGEPGEATDPAQREAQLARAERNERAAADLTAAARRWRDGTLR